MLNKFRSRLTKLWKLQRLFSTQVQKSAGSTVIKSDRLQFSKARLTDFGDLPVGQIPDALEYDLPFSCSTLKNGIKVATESFSSQLASITVCIKAGTRQETPETSGVNQFLERLNLRGTSTKNRSQVENELQGFGGNFTIKTSRETTTYTLSFQKEQLQNAVNFLGDILLNSVYNQNQVEAERDAVYRQCIENHKDQKSVTIEAAHYTSFRDHFFSQPIHGVRENIANITAQHVKDFHAQNYFGNNIVIAGAGNLVHSEFQAAIDKAFGKFPAGPPAGTVKPNDDVPLFTPSMLYMRDDEMANVNIGVFFAAPTYNDPDYFAFKLLKRIVGEYRADKHTGGQLNSADRQYNLLHSELGQMPDVTLQKCEYLAYSDCGLFGNYLYGNEVFANQILFLSQVIVSEYASYINPVEVFRGKNSFYNELLGKQNSFEVSKGIARQITNQGRRIPRSETAKRISHIDAGILNRVCTRWLWDKEISVVAWGPIHHLMAFSHYNRPIKRSTLGWYGNQHLRII